MKQQIKGSWRILRVDGSCSQGGTTPEWRNPDANPQKLLDSYRGIDCREYIVCFFEEQGRRELITKNYRLYKTK